METSFISLLERIIDLINNGKHEAAYIIINKCISTYPGYPLFSQFLLEAKAIIEIENENYELALLTLWRLFDDYPDLTHTQIALAAYIRMMNILEKSVSEKEAAKFTSFLERTNQLDFLERTNQLDFLE